MEISQQFLIDMALNIGGYVLAGLVSVVVYALLQRKNEPPTAAQVAVEDVPEQKPRPLTSRDGDNRRIEFIKLGERATAANEIGSPESPPNAAAVGDRRNRAETIRIARTMLKAGASNDKIKRLIPISDAELSLLSMSKS